MLCGPQRLLTEQSTNYAETSIEVYDERRAKQLEFWKGQNGRQPGDPAKLARALVVIASQEPPPRRFIAGADALALAEQKVADLKAQIHHRPAASHGGARPYDRRLGGKCDVLARQGAAWAKTAASSSACT